MGGRGTIGTCAVTVLVATACAGSVAAADERLCHEVARVTDELADAAGALPTPGEPRGASADTDSGTAADRYDHDIAITGSHLLVAAGGDIDGEPDPELAAVVRSAGAAGVGGRLDGYVERLAEAHDACGEVGVAMARGPLEALDSVADQRGRP